MRPNRHSESRPSRGTRALLVMLLAGVPVLSAVAADTDVSASASTGGAPRTEDLRCIRDTGTHLRSASTARRAAPQRNDKTDAVASAGAEAGCNGLPGNSYSRADIERTGATSVAEALRLLDPAVH